MPEMNFLQQFKNLFSEATSEETNHRSRILGLTGLINNADFVVYYRREAQKTKLIAGWNLPSDFHFDAKDRHSHVACFLDDTVKTFEQVEHPQSYKSWAEDTHLKKLPNLSAIWLIDLGSHELGRGALVLYFFNPPKRPLDGLASLQQCATMLRFEEERRLFEARSKPYQNASKPIIEGVTLADASQPGTPLIFVNPGFEKLTGYSNQEVMGRNCKFLQGEATDPKTIQRLSQAICNQEGIRVEILNYRKDQTEFWNLLSIQPVFDGQGKLTYFLGLQLDITQWRHDYLEPKRQDLAEQQASQNASQTQGVMILDEAGVVVSAEDHLAEIFGFEGTHQITSRKLNELIANMDEQTLVQQIQEQHQTPFPMAFFVKQGIRQTGDFFPISYTLHPLPESDTGQVLVLVQDLSKAQEHERTTKASQHDSQQSQQIKARLLDDMSYTIRNKLHAMLSYARFGMKKLPVDIDPSISDHLTSITVTGDQLLSYIDHLLALARIEAEPQLFRAMRQDISILVENLLKQFDRQLLQKKINLDYEVKIKDTHAWLDNASIKQILFHTMDKIVQNCKQGDHIHLQLLPGVIRRDGSRFPAITLIIAANLKNATEVTTDLGTPDETIEKGTDISILLAQSIMNRYGGQLETRKEGREERFLLRLPLLPVM